MALKETIWKSLGEIAQENWIKACNHVKTKNSTGYGDGDTGGSN
jgi:hypothetical protein